MKLTKAQLADENEKLRNRICELNWQKADLIDALQNIAEFSILDWSLYWSPKNIAKHTLKKLK